MITLWYLGPGDRICADVIHQGRIVYSTAHPFPATGSKALFWLAVSALTQEIKSEVRV
jgi:hypothetical protein